MRTLVPTLALPLVVATGCASGAAGPPALAYGLPIETEVTYEVADTLSVAINALGQRLELGVGSLAIFGLVFAEGPEGLVVTMSLEELAAQLNVPMAGPVDVDESIIDGELVFSLDRRGAASVISAPDVGGAAGLFSPTSIASTFFPRLPGRAVGVGDSWVDTVSFVEDGAAGDGSQSTVLEYTVVGDSRIGGRTLLEISFTGRTLSDQVMDLQGTPVQQKSELEVTGRVLWDVQRRLMMESETTSTGTGTVEVALLPGQLPTQVEIRSRARLRE